MKADRLNSTDEMLAGAGGSLGSSRIVQVLWRFPTAVSSAALRGEWARLNSGRLSRGAVPALVPGARRRWVAAHNAEPLHESTRVLTGKTVTEWMDEQIRAPLPVGSDALWRLAAARCGSGTIVSLTVPHFRSDGLGVFAAIAAPRPRGGPPPAPSMLGDDIGDALGQVAHAVINSAHWIARLSADRPERDRVRAALRSAGSPAPASEPRFFVSAVLDLDAARWHERAEARGGTVNSLFVEIAANLVRARVPRAGDAVTVGIPTNLRRSAADGRANALVVVPLGLPGGTPQYDDLVGTRRETKAVLRDIGDASATLVPEPLWHLLPARYSTRLKAPGGQQTDVVASNFGPVPDGVVCFAGARADSIAVRTMNVPGLVPEKARLRASLCLSQVGDRLTVTVTGIPDQFGDADALTRLAVDEFARWGLAARCWP